MADMGSLERMGRELKCPICLSLLKSAVSVTCNHIFCNDCLSESMKSSSSCPVCKVPYRRREIRPAPHMDNLVGILKGMEAATGTNVVSTQVTSAAEVAEGSKHANSGKKSKRSRKSTAQKKKIASKKEANTTKPTVASASCPTKKPSFSTNKRIHVTPFPESETPVRPRKIMKPEEPKSKLNVDDQGKDKALTSDKSEGFSLSPFFWLNEREDEEGCTAETLSEPLSLATPLRHNAPCFSDIKDSEDETPPNATPNSKAKVPQVFDSEIFEWTQIPCSPELCSTPSKKQDKCKDILDHVADTYDEEDIQLGGSFGRLSHASNAAQLVDAKERKQKRKKAQGRNSKKAKLPDHLKVSIIEADANQQDSNSTKRLAAKSCEKNSSAKEKKTSSRRNKAFGNINLFPCSNDNSSETFLPQDGTETEAHDEQLSKRSQRKQKNSKQKKSARKLGTAGTSTVETTGTNCEPSSKRVRKMPDGVNTEKIRVIDGCRNETEIPVLHSFMRSCTQHKLLDGKSKKSKFSGEMNSHIGLATMKSNIGGSTSSILLGRCQSNETIHTAPSVMDVYAKNNCANGVNEADCSGMKNFGNLQASTVHNSFLKKCDDTVSKVSYAFCQSVDITEVSGEMVHYHNGKQVPSQFSGGANVIHAHKNCTEWAPDVYFEAGPVLTFWGPRAKL